jgi:peptidase M42 family hydrolase
MATHTEIIMRNLKIDRTYLLDCLNALLETPSPSGMTDSAVAFVCAELEQLDIHYELTRRGAIRADLAPKEPGVDRAIVCHLDTLGAMVKRIRENGRLGLVPIGTWSPRFAEGARVTVYSDGEKRCRGTILPLKASGHTFNEEVETQPASWENLEVRIDERTASAEDTAKLGIRVGDTISIDPQPEFLDNGFINSRHLDDKAGVAAVLAAAKAVREAGLRLSMGCHLVFTISEEVGIGASHVLHGDVAELLSIDNGTVAPGQNTSEYGATIAMQDSSGPFDWYLTRSLISLSEAHGIPYSRDVFRYYRSDAAAALEAGNDIRTALLCFALDASHGWERTHVESLEAVARLISLYIQSPPLFARDIEPMGPIGDLPAGEADYEHRDG